MTRKDIEIAKNLFEQELEALQQNSENPVLEKQKNTERIRALSTAIEALKVVSVMKSIL